MKDEKAVQFPVPWAKEGKEQAKSEEPEATGYTILQDGKVLKVLKMEAPAQIGEKP